MSAAFDDFQTLSRRYWQAWTDSLREGGAPDFAMGPRNPWRSAMDAWVSSGLVSQHDMDAAVGQFTRLSGDWLGRMQELAAQFTGRTGTATEIAEAWRAMLEAGGALPPLSELIQQMPGAQWWQGSGEAWLKALQARPSALLDLPTFGLSREHAERAQALGRAQLELQERVQAWQALLQQSTQDAIARFERKLEEHAAPGKQITSVRGLFDVWVDAAEEAYAQMALSREYRTAYGALTDAQMRLRAAAQAIAEQVAKATGMPGREELDGAHRKVAELERQLRRLRADAQARPGARARGSSGPASAEEAPPPARAAAKKTARKSAKPTKAAKSDKASKAAKPDKASKAAKPGKTSKAATASKAAKVARASKAGKTGKAAKAVARKKPARSALPDIRMPGVAMDTAPARRDRSKRR